MANEDATTGNQTKNATTEQRYRVAPFFSFPATAPRPPAPNLFWGKEDSLQRFLGKKALELGIFRLKGTPQMYENIKISDSCPKDKFNYESYYDIPIITPRNSIAFQVRKMLEEFIRSKCSPGVYRDHIFINTLF